MLSLRHACYVSINCPKYVRRMERSVGFELCNFSELIITLSLRNTVALLKPFLSKNIPVISHS
jgi:hypothetical protein